MTFYVCRKGTYEIINMLPNSQKGYAGVKRGT